jgi:hypothetical protein
MTESVLARAELFRRGMMFDGVPQMSSTELELPAGTAEAAPGGEGAAMPGADPAADSQALPAVPAGTPETTDELVAGAVKHESPLETMVAGT